MRALLVTTLLVSATAHAQGDGDVGVVVTGEAVLQPQVRAGVEMWLRDHGRTVVGSPLLPDATNKLIDCFVIEDAACAKSVVEQSTAPAIVFVRADVTDTTKSGRDFALAGTWLAKGKDPQTLRRTCHHCTEEQMRETLVSLLGSLVVEPPPPPPAPPAPAAPALPAPTTAVVAPPPAPAPTEDPLARNLPYGLVGGGALLLVTGVILIAVDQSPDPHGPQPKSLRDTETAGIALGLIGAAAAGAGSYLWWRDHHGGAPIAAVSHEGALVGWSGRF
ncbi:MAG: hypothetical protein JO257_16995 [Deltaproteobacteria bacterium]|nr:hypothetical protein [Deltaproteobacteria bacterium]